MCHRLVWSIFGFRYKSTYYYYEPLSLSLNCEFLIWSQANFSLFFGVIVSISTQVMLGFKKYFLTLIRKIDVKFLISSIEYL